MARRAHRAATPAALLVAVAAIAFLAPCPRAADQAGSERSPRPPVDRTVPSPSAPSIRTAQAGQPPVAPTRVLRARTFRIRYRNPGDVATLIQSALSDAGSFTLQPKLNTLVVQDTEEALARVTDLIHSFDMPPRNVEVTINLFMGSREAAGKQSIARQVRGITDVLSDITKWDHYEVLDSASIMGSEGAMTSRTLAGEKGKPDAYRIELGIQSVDEEHGVITVNPFTVQKEYRPEEGSSVWRQVYSTKLNLRNGQMLTLGAARDEKSDKALFLTLRARVME